MDVDEVVPEVEVDFSGLDVFAADDVCNLGGGMPIFKEFLFEDWTLMSLRYELYLLVQAFRKDCGDPERAGIHIDHLGFYYNKYYKKSLNTKFFGVETFADVVALVKDSVYITKQQVLDTQLPAELETFGIFVKLAEEARRYRNLQLDLGETSARINIQQGYASGKGEKRGFKGEPKGQGKFDGKKGDFKGPFMVKGDFKGPAVPFQVPVVGGKDGKGMVMKGDFKGQQKGGMMMMDPRGAPPPPPSFQQQPPYGAVSYAKGKDAGKGKDFGKDFSKGKDMGKDMGKGKFDNRGPEPFKGDRKSVV